MSLIFTREQGANPISEEILQNAIDLNQDGYGIAAWNGTNIEIFKSIVITDFMLEFRALEKLDYKMIVFLLDEDVYYGSNVLGNLSPLEWDDFGFIVCDGKFERLQHRLYIPGTDTVKSPANIFVDKLNLYTNDIIHEVNPPDTAQGVWDVFLENPYILSVLGQESRVAIMTKTGDIIYHNKSQWASSDNDLVWYSNMDAFESFLYDDIDNPSTSSWQVDSIMEYFENGVTVTLEDLATLSQFDLTELIEAYPTYMCRILKDGKCSFENATSLKPIIEVAHRDFVEEREECEDCLLEFPEKALTEYYDESTQELIYLCMHCAKTDEEMGNVFRYIVEAEQVTNN